MKNALLTILSLLILSLYSMDAKNSSNQRDEDPKVSETTIIYNSNTNTGDDRAYLFPFHIEYDEQNNSLIITYDQERPAALDLTRVNGTIINHQSISASGIYSMSLPSVSGTLYLFMTTPTLCAYVTISIF